MSPSEEIRDGASPAGSELVRTNPTVEQLRERLPRSIVEKLDLVIRRIHRIILLRGVMMVTAVAMGLLLVLMAIDGLIVMFSRTLHTVLSLCALLVTIAVAWLCLVRPLLRRYTLTAIARLLEIRHPELEERISSAIDLLGSNDSAVKKGSDALIAELVKAAEVDALAVRPQMEFTLRTAKPYLIAVAAMAGVVVLLFLVWPASTYRLLARTLIPYANVGNAYSSRLAVTPGSTRIAFGDALVIRAELHGSGANRVELRCTGDSGVETVERMASEENSLPGTAAFMVKFPSVEAHFKYRVRAGNALSEYYQVRVERRPEVARLKIAYEFPAYTGLLPMIEEGVPGDIVAPSGSKLKLLAMFNKPLAVAELLVDGRKVGNSAAGIVDGNPGKEWDLSIPRGLSGAWCLNLVDDMSTTNRRVDYRIQAIPDAIPTVELSEPGSTTLKLKPTEFVPVAYIASDDYGIKTASMLVSVDNGKPVIIELQPPTRDRAQKDKWVGQGKLDLSSLQLEAAKSLSVRIAVTDGLPPDMLGPQTGMSEVVSIQLDRQAESLPRQTIAAIEVAIRADIAFAKAKLEEAGIKAAGPDGQAEPKLADITDIRQLAEQAEDTLRKLADKTVETPFARLARPLNDVADRNVEPAIKAAELIPLTDNAAERARNVDAMRKDLKDAVAALDELSKQVDKARDDAQNLAAVKDLANRQDQLAQEAKNLTGGPKDANKEEIRKWKEAQDEVLKKLADMVKKDPEALNQQMAGDRKAASELASATRQLADQQKALANQALQNPDGARQQSDIARQADAIKADTGKLAEKLEQLGGPQEQAAKNAVGAQHDMEQAGSKMQAAIDKMAQQPQSSSAQKPAAEQQQAGEKLQQASEQLAQAAKALADQVKSADAKQDAAGQKPGQPPANNQESKAGESKSRSESKSAAAKEGKGKGKGAGKGEGEGKGKGQGKGKGKGTGKGKGEGEGEPGAPPGPGGDAPGGLGSNGPAPGQGAPPDSSTSLAEAFDQAANAIASASMSEAAPSAEQAAEQLAQLASATAQSMGMSKGPGGKPGKPGKPGGPGGGPPGQSPDSSGTPGGDNEQGVSGGTWLKPKGTLSGNVRDSSDDNTAADYRDLVKRYFKAVAHEGDKQK